MAHFHSTETLSSSATMASPRLVSFRNRLYLFYRGDGFDRTIWWRCFDGKKWGPQEELPTVRSDQTPAVIACPEGILLAWAGPSPDQLGDGIHWVQFDPSRGLPAGDGVGTFPGPVDPVGAPSLARVGDSVYMAWLDRASAKVHAACFANRSWRCVDVGADVTTEQSPVLGAAGGRLCLFWLKQPNGAPQPQPQPPPGGDERDVRPTPILFAWRQEDGSWDRASEIAGACSNRSPCVVYFRGSLHLFWSHTQGHGRVDWTFFESSWGHQLDAPRWRRPSPLPWSATDQTPSAAALGDHLHLAWKEKESKSIQWSVDSVDNRLSGLKWRDVGQQMAPLAQTVSAVGILLYALARISIQAFYAELDISPETAGQSYLSTLIPVAVALGAFVILAALTVSFATLIAEWSWGGKQIRHLGHALYRMPPRRNRAIHEASAQSVGIYFFSAFALMTFAILLFVLQGLGLFQVDPYVNVALAAIVVTPFVSLVIQSYVSGGKPYGVTMLAAGLVAVVGIGVLAHQYGSAEGRAARHGNPLHNTFAGFSFPPLSATPIEVQLLDPRTGDPQPPFQAGDCLLDLGEANGYVVLYDVPRATVWRLPQANAVLSQSKSARGCLESTKQSA